MPRERLPMSSSDKPILDFARGTSQRMNRYTRTFLTLFDQGVFSIATYATGVFVSRNGESQFGWYFLVFTLWIFGTELHNSLVSTPQMLKLPGLRGGRAKSFNGSILVHQLTISLLATLVLAIAAAVIRVIAFTAGDENLVGYSVVAFMGAASVAPLALRNFARNYCFTTRDPVTATILDISVSVLQLGGIALAHFTGLLKTHWWLAVVIVAVANLMASLMWLSMARGAFVPNLRRAWIDFKRNWPAGRYIYLSSTLWTAGTYLYPWLISVVAGTKQAGVWGVCFTLANLGNPLIMGIQNIMGPSIAHAFTDRPLQAFRRYVLKCSVLFMLLGSVGALTMALAAEFLIRRLNGPAYAGYGRVTGLLAVTMLLQGLSFPTSRGLFSLNRAKLDMISNIGPLIVLVGLGVVLIREMDVMGAAICLVIAQVIGSASRILFFLQASADQRQRAFGLADKSSAAA